MFTNGGEQSFKRVLEPEVKAEHPVGRPKKGANLAQITGQKTRSIVSSFTGVSHGTLEKAEVTGRACPISLVAQ